MAPERSRPQAPVPNIKRTPVPPPNLGKSISTKAAPILQELVSSASSASENEASPSASSSASDSESSSSSSRGRNRSRSPTNPPRRAISGASSAPTSFKPPHGFQPLSTDPSSSRAAKLFDPSNSKGKQIWHIVAPAGVPVNTLKEVSIQKVKAGEAVLSHNGSDYGFAVVDEAAAGTYKSKLLVPSKTGSGYELAGLNISQTLNLQLVRLPSLSNPTIESTGDAPQSSNVPTPAKKPVRQQPKGLRVRCAPLGTGASNSTEPYAWSSSADDSEESGAERLNRAKEASQRVSQTNGIRLPKKSKVTVPQLTQSNTKRSRAPSPNKATLSPSKRSRAPLPYESAHILNGFTATPLSRPEKRKRHECKPNGDTPHRKTTTTETLREAVEPVEPEASPKKKRSKHKHREEQEVGDSQATRVSVTEADTSQETIKESSQRGRDTEKRKHSSHHRSSALEFDAQGRRRETSKERAKRKEKEKRRREKEVKESRPSSHHRHSQRENSVELT